MNYTHFKLCQKIANETQPFGNAKIGCILAYRNDIISISNNFNPKSHPLAKQYGKNPFAIFPHAELKCLINAEKSGFSYWEKSILYVVRVHKNGSIAMAEPCEGCKRAIQKFSVGQVIFSISEDHYGKL